MGTRDSTRTSRIFRVVSHASVPTSDSGVLVCECSSESFKYRLDLDGCRLKMVY